MGNGMTVLTTNGSLRVAFCVLLAACDSTAPAVATHVGFLTEPQTSVAATQPLGPVSVELLTADGLRAPNATATVELSLTGLGGAQLSGTTSATTVDGIATFSNLSVDKAGVAYALSAKAAGFPDAVSRPFTITVGPPVTLHFEPVNGSSAGNQIPHV